MGRGQATATKPEKRVQRRSTRGLPAASLLSRREAAEFAGTSLGAVDKAVEAGIIRVTRGPSRSARIPVSEVAPLAVLARLGVNVPNRLKRHIRDWVVSQGTQRRGSSKELELGPSLVVRIAPEAYEAADQAKRYGKLRERYIESNPEVKGGASVIRGRRLTASAVAARLAGGDTLDEVAEDYSYIEREALEAAAVYGRTHPRRGRPPRPPRPER